MAAIVCCCICMSIPVIHVVSLALSGDGKRLFSGSADSTIKVWDLGAGKEVVASTTGEQPGKINESRPGKWQKGAASLHDPGFQIEGHTPAEIARRLDRSVRTVQRKVQVIRDC